MNKNCGRYKQDKTNLRMLNWILTVKGINYVLPSRKSFEQVERKVAPSGYVQEWQDGVGRYYVGIVL